VNNRGGQSATAWARREPPVEHRIAGADANPYLRVAIARRRQATGAHAQPTWPSWQAMPPDDPTIPQSRRKRWRLRAGEFAREHWCTPQVLSQTAAAKHFYHVPAIDYDWYLTTS
jgi:hypothetical protein